MIMMEPTISRKDQVLKLYQLQQMRHQNQPQYQSERRGEPMLVGRDNFPRNTRLTASSSTSQELDRYSQKSSLRKKLLS
jgi:hypothetical protein